MDGLVERLASSGAFLSYCTALYEAEQCGFRRWGNEFDVAAVQKVSRVLAVPEADHSNLVSRLRTSGFMPSLPYAFMVHTETSVPCIYLLCFGPIILTN